MSREFDEAITPAVKEDDFSLIIGTVPLLSPKQLKRLRVAVMQAHEEDNPTRASASNGGGFSLKEEVTDQILILRALREELFDIDGGRRTDTSMEEVSGFLNASLRLLQLLQRFEESLLTDEDVRKIVYAVEMAVETLPKDSEVAKDFVEAVREHLG